MTLSIVQNAALLLAMAFVFDVAILGRAERRIVRGEHVDAPGPVAALLRRFATGVVLGVVGVAAIASSWELQDGVILDTRSVILTAAGLFFGAIPAALAVIITAAYRLSQGGAGAMTGASVIVVTAAIGLGARRWLGARLEQLTWRHLAAVGIVAHVAMLVTFLVVPFDGSTEVVRDIAVPVMLVYPTTFVLLGLLLVGRSRSELLIRRVAESEDRYHTLFDNEHIIMLVIDPDDGRILDANGAACAFYGWSRDELLAMTTSDLEVLPRDEVLRQIDEGIAQHRSLFEFQHRLRNGEIRDVEVNGGAVTMNGQMRIHAVITDVSDRKRAQLELVVAQEHLRQSQKMEAVGRLAGGVAHDFNNMLQVILGYVELLRADIPPGSDLEEPLAEIHEAAERSAELTQQLLTFARKQPVLPRVLDLGASIVASGRMLERMVGSDVTIEYDISDDLWLVRVDESQLGQVLANLVLNARDAMDGGGRLRICAANEVVTVLEPDDPPEAAAGEYVRVTVTDDGRGIPSDMLGSIFEPFFTTRGSNGGTGLGLAIVYGVVAQHGGFIRVESSVGEGTTFHLMLPRAGDASPAPPPPRRVVL